MVDQEVFKDILDKLGYNSFEEIIEEFQHKVYSTVFAFIQNSQDAEDLSQEVFLLVYQNLCSFKLDSKLSTWIYKITVNRCLMYRRKAARRQNLAKIIPMNKDIAESMPDEQTVDIDIIKQEDSQYLYQALNLISQKYSAVITLRYMQDLSIKEIGQILNLPARTVETQLYRAKSKLKTSLLSLGYNTEEIHNGL